MPAKERVKKSVALAPNVSATPHPVPPPQVGRGRSPLLTESERWDDAIVERGDSASSPLVGED